MTVEENKNESEPIFEKNHSMLRWPILAFCSMMLFCSYYAFDIPSAIKPQLSEYLGNPSDFEISFSLLYTLYAAPNVSVTFFEISICTYLCLVNIRWFFLFLVDIL